MGNAQVIYGGNLIKYASFTDMPEELKNSIDPDGFSVVEMAFPHNDRMEEWRLVVLFKLVNQEEPHIGKLNVSSYAFSKLVQTLKVDTGEH